uniref:F-box domain-containing protein n=1 Tax=Triticum urartu TaxID=4572 RepID=A0A8R7UND8_TRIUA
MLPLDDENLVSEILLRLPPLPSSLPRASLVCKRWRSILSDTRFLRRFRLHHRRSPPLLGCFDKGLDYSDSPDCVPTARFSLQLDYSSDFLLLSCRHGLVLISFAMRRQAVVWDPVTGDQHRLAVPPGFGYVASRIHGAVLRAPGEVHHFQVVLVEAATDGAQHMRLLACVYSSETGAWGNLISTSVRGAFIYTMFTRMPGLLIGNSLYWLFEANHLAVILEFDLEKQSLVAMQAPTDVENNLTVMRADDGGLGLLSI